MISENLNLIDGESLWEDRASNARLLAEQFDPRGRINDILGDLYFPAMDPNLRRLIQDNVHQDSEINTPSKGSKLQKS